MKGAFIFLLALVPFTLLITTDASGKTTLVPTCRIKFGAYCQWYLGYDNDECFVGPSPINQHWYRAYDSSRPGKFMLVTHPVPVTALKVECSPSYSCSLKLVTIPQLYPGWPFPAGLGDEYFFTEEVKGELFAIKSVIKPNLAITVLSDGSVDVTKFVCSYNQLFCVCPPNPTSTPLPEKVCKQPLGLTQHEVVGRIKKAPDCHQFLGYSNYTWALFLQGPSPAHQHWSFFSGSASTDGSFMIATYPAPNKVLKVECLLSSRKTIALKAAASTSCSLKLVNAPCPLLYDTEFCFPGEEYLFTKVKPDDKTFVIKSVLKPGLAITINGNNVLLSTSGQAFCCPQIQPTPTASVVTGSTEYPTPPKYSAGLYSALPH